MESLSIDTQTLAAWDKAHSWHPFTPMTPYMASDPVMIQRGEGVKLQDIHGRWYYDGVSSVWLNVHGHNVPSLNQAVQDQLQEIAHSTLLGQANVPSTILAKRLVDIAPSGMTRVFFSDSGATAVEIALKMAIQYWANQGHAQKKYILGFTNNYHGDTIGAMGVAADTLFHWPFLDMLPDHPRAPYPYSYRYPADAELTCEEASLQEVERIFSEEGERLAAVIIEPVEGAGGIIPAPRGYLKKLRALCDQYDVLLIVDEVATGFGRTGTMFACDAEGITPDILCLGKGITGGYLPLAATLATEELFSAFLGERYKTLYHGHSYTGNQLASAVALANLDLFEDLFPTLPEKAQQLTEWLAPFHDLPFIGDVRHRGFMVGFELVTDKMTKAPFPAELLAGYKAADAVRERGMLIRPIGNVVIFMPPLASTPEELREMMDILYAAFQDAAVSLKVENVKH